MKQYLIRNVGWVYDDSLYFNDGLYHNVAIFDTAEEALIEAEELNREFLIQRLSFIHRHQTWTNFKADFANWRNSVHDFLITEFDFNPTILLYPFSKELSIFMFARRPSVEQLDRLAKQTKVEFFKVVEIDDSTPFFYAKLNPAYGEGDEYLATYLTEEHMIFSSKKEAVAHYRKTFEHSAEALRNHQNVLSGSLAKLSRLPAHLQSLINASPGLSYDGKTLKVSASVSDETLTSLNELLTQAFLLFEQTALKEIPPFSANDIKNVKKENRSDWQTVEKRFAAHSSLEALKQSKEYLLSYCFRLPTRLRFDRYATILQAFLTKEIDSRIELNHGTFTLLDRRLLFYGVIVEMREEADSFVVKSLFGLNKHAILEESSKGHGEASTLQEAFEISLEDWLNKNRILLKELIAAVAQK